MVLPWEGRDGAALGRAGRCCLGKGGTVLPWEGRDGAALGKGGTVLPWGYSVFGKYPCCVAQRCAAQLRSTAPRDVARGSKFSKHQRNAHCT
eukprot:gene11813-biopygen4883